jgi:hypothetical protein
VVHYVSVRRMCLLHYVVWKQLCPFQFGSDFLLEYVRSTRVVRVAKGWACVLKMIFLACGDSLILYCSPHQNKYLCTVSSILRIRGLSFRAI